MYSSGKAHGVWSEGTLYPNDQCCYDKKIIDDLVFEKWIVMTTKRTLVKVEMIRWDEQE